jgi:hypothetical protein
LDTRLAWQVIDGEAVVVDLARGRTLGLNPSASLIWSLLPDHDEGAIARALNERFDVDVRTARADVAEFVRSLRERGLVSDTE